MTSKNLPHEKFEPEALWSRKEFERWEKQAFKFFLQWAPLLLVSGVAGGLGAILFRLLIILNQGFFFGFLAAHRVPIVFLPVIGGIIVGPIIYKWASEAWGHGVPEVMEALRLRGGRIRARVAAVKIIASSITIGSGGSAGREGPIAQIGASISSVVGQLLHLDDRSLRLMLMAGASAGISGTFKAPIGGALFGLEVLDKKIRTTDLIVMVFSSIVGYLVSVAILGPAPVFVTQGIVLNYADIPLYAILGIIGGFVSFLWTRSLYGVEDLFARLRIGRKWFSPFLGGWVVGGIGIFFPAALGLGYNVIDEFFTGKLPINYTGSLAIFFLLLFLAKLGTSSFTIGSGGSGGVFSPSLFMGAMLGAIFGLFVSAAFPSIAPGYRSFALVGMAIIFAGAAKAPIMSTIIVTEMSQNYTLLPAIFIASIMSYLVSGPGSIYIFKVMRSEGRDIPDDYLSTPQLPAIVRLAQAAIKGAGKKDDYTKPAENPPALKIGESRSITKSVNISAPAEKVFAVCSDPKAFALFVPGVENVNSVREGNSHIGDTFKAHYAFLGSSFEEVLTFAEYERPRQINTKFEGPLKANLKITLESKDGPTKATLEYKYEKINGNVVAAAKNEKLVEGRLEKDAQYLLENLKMVCELPTDVKTMLNPADL